METVPRIPLQAMREGTAPLPIPTETGTIPLSTPTKQWSAFSTVHAVTGVPEPTSAPILGLG